MVERKLSDRASREYWEKVDRIGKEVDRLPRWMKGGSDSSANRSSAPRTPVKPVRKTKA